MTGDPAAEGQVSLFRDREADYATPVLFGQPIGQIEDTFIVAYTQDEVFFIDQHVAHERVLFEQLRSELDTGPLAGQALLFPAARRAGAGPAAGARARAPGAGPPRLRARGVRR